MSCIKNPQSFLGIKYEGPHDWETIDIGVFMAHVSDEFRVKNDVNYADAGKKNLS
jgi:hypothetical protein